MPGSLGPGGSERQASYTAAGAAQRGYDIHLGCERLDPPADFFKSVVEASGAQIWKIEENAAEYGAPAVRDLRRRFAADETLKYLLDRIFHYALLIREIRPTVVHTWMDWQNVLAGIASELVGVPGLVLGGRSLAPDNFPALFQPFMHAGYTWLFNRRPFLLLNNSSAGARDYARWLRLGQEEIRVVHNGYEFPTDVSAETRVEVRRMYGVSANTPLVGSIIRFSEEKQPCLFVDMARILHRECPEIRFLFFGVGPLLDETRAYAENQGLSSEVLQMPGLTHQSWNALSSMDVFVLTSRVEGLPNVLIEAQASGVPVVCTGAGGMSETFAEGETGYSVDGSSAEALAAAVSRLIRDPVLRRRMSQQAFQFARCNFSIDHMIDRTCVAYRESLRGNEGESFNPVVQRPAQGKELAENVTK
jgi:glycosyltransferase involved in cell wall biosynthesis